MLFVIVSSILILSQSLQAAIEPNYYLRKSEQVPFFKSQTSLFPSGSINLEKLKKHLVLSQSETDRFYQWNKIYFAEHELTPLFATHLSQHVITNKTRKRYRVIEVTTKSIQVADEDTSQIIKLKLHDVHADAYDKGLSISLKDIYLKSAPRDNALIKTTIPQGTRLNIESFSGAFAKVSYQSYTGYVTLSEIVTKFDFASFVYAENEWHQVSKRQFDQLITVKNKKISMNSVKGLITPNDVGLIASSQQKIPIWSQIKLTNKNVTTWQQSKLKEHGLVWWKPNREFEQTYYSIDELLKMTISSASFNPYNPVKGIVSANGVYITENGSQWRRLNQFEDYNGPVYYLNDHLIFVGHFRSLNGGTTFENYIQIDKLASAIEYEFGFTPKFLQVKKIESPTPLKITIEVDIGRKRIQMQSPIFSQNWKAVRI